MTLMASGPIALTDDRGRKIRLKAPPARIVSLVPSDSYSLAWLGVGERLVGRTSYCVEPETLADVADVGGTKNPDVERILALEPDLVIANQEENSRADIEKLEQRGVVAFVSFPRRVAEGIGQLARLARLLGITEERKKLVANAYARHQEAEAGRAPREGGVRVFAPIWMDPLMTIHHDTFISDVIELVGGTNVFSTRERLYPLAADLGKADPLPEDKVTGRDTRYPRITLDEVVAAQPDVVLLPDEPHAFTEEDANVFRGLDIPAAKTGRIHFVSGRDLMWPGARSLEGLDRLRSVISGAAPSSSEST